MPRATEDAELFADASAIRCIEHDAGDRRALQARHVCESGTFEILARTAVVFVVK
jgi:hypothetical protein